MFYQSSLVSLLFRHHVNHNFPLHLHENFELITVKDGEMTVTVDKIEYHLKKGSAILVFPNQPHSLHTSTYSEDQICIFSLHLVEEYKNMILNKLPKSNLFYPNPFYLEALFSLDNNPNIFKTKGLLYSICAEFDDTAEYKEKKIESKGLLIRIFEFIEKNHAKQCDLRTLSNQISYHEVYLSRYFKQHTGLTFSDYVNRYRINESTYILKKTQKKILEVALDCGFTSLRSFNRNFKAIIGLTPNEYRAQYNALHTSPLR